MYASVLIEYEVKSLDRIFTYKIPKELLNKIKKGMRVRVPFSNKIINGLVLDINDKYDNSFDIKNISDIVDEEIYFNEELLSVGRHLQDLTLCNLVTAYKTMLPSSLKIKEQKRDYRKYETYLKLKCDLDAVNVFINNNKRAKKQIEILETLLNEDKVLKNLFPSEAINSLIKKGLITTEKEQVYRLNKINEIIKPTYSLSEEQEKTYNNIKSKMNNYMTHLIYGVTASGKTEVYFRLIDDAIKNNKTALMLVPEITLTTQMINRFYERFGDDVAIYHSGLSDGERNDEYLKIYRGEVKIVVGTRSCIFAPVKNLGIIIIDEEHSDNFKQDTNPRYNAVDIAKYRGKYNNIPVVLGSATPLLESMARAKMNVYELHEMKKRINNAVLPEVLLIDMASNIKNGYNVISQELEKEIRSTVERHEQVILLLNRRGFSPFIMCNNCGYSYKCKNCDITLTYHKTTNNLRCHYCGYTVFKEDKCPECHEDSLSYYGLGTEKLEEYLKKTFPMYKTIRMDTDTTSKKGSHEKILDEFKNHRYDILIGTQMISKGLDFPLVTLVGVINADASLNIPDFRSSERTFALLDQVAGRAGRSNLPGKVLIETFNPDNYILNCVKNHNYDAFYSYETDIRKKLCYPPYYFLTSIKIISHFYEEASAEATKLSKYLLKKIDSSTMILGPTTAAIFKVNNTYRFQIVLKYKKDSLLRQVLSEVDNMYKFNPKIRIEIDNNPMKI